MAIFEQKFSGRNRVDMRLWMDIPKRPEFIAQSRVWNKIVKDAVREALVYHHNTHIPRHFKRDARQRYEHKPRSEKYKAWKKRRFGSLLDLVLTGRTRDKLTKPQGYDKIVVGGAAEGGKKSLEGKLIYQFGFVQDIKNYYASKKAQTNTRDPRARKAGQRQQNPNRVTLRDMRAELQRITQDEADDLRTVFLKAVEVGITNIRAGRKRVGRK